jgi:hypothetical protein
VEKKVGKMKQTDTQKSVCAYLCMSVHT